MALIDKRVKCFHAFQFFQSLSSWQEFHLIMQFSTHDSEHKLLMFVVRIFFRFSFSLSFSHIYMYTQFLYIAYTVSLQLEKRTKTYGNFRQLIVPKAIIKSIYLSTLRILLPSPGFLFFHVAFNH